jgi:hypothetical protein
MFQEEAPGKGLRRVLEEDPLLRTGLYQTEMQNYAGQVDQAVAGLQADLICVRLFLVVLR